MRRSRRQSSSAVLLIGLAALAAGCRPAEEANQTANVGEGSTEPAVNLSAVRPAAPPIDRAALLTAVARAASAAASAQDDSGAQRELDGKRFELRIRFGCEGPQERLASAPIGWTYDAEKRVLRVRAAPTISAADPIVAQVKPEDVEAVQGFWIPRPWLLGAACPAHPPAAPPEEVENGAAPVPGQPGKEAAEPLSGVAAGPKVGIAQFFMPDDARTGRRDRRAYETTKTLVGNAQPGGEGFELVLSGRLRALGGRVIHCVGASADRAPDCVASARIDRVRVERPGGEMIAEWSSS